MAFCTHYAANLQSDVRFCAACAGTVREAPPTGPLVAKPTKKTVLFPVLGALVLLLGPRPAQAAEFSCPAGDVACLIDAITTANGNGQANTITLAAGTYTLTAVNNVGGGGPNGLPLITSTLTIRGAGAETTLIERAAGAPAFRIFFVMAAGALTLEGLTISGGVSSGVAGGLWNDGGTVTIASTTFVGNRANGNGGALFNGNVRGTVILTSSTLADNIATLGEGGGLFNLGTATITNSTIAGNSAGSFGGGIINRPAFGLGGRLTLTNSTIAGNTAALLSAKGGGLYNGGGTMTITNSTLADNTAPFGSTGGLVNVFLGTVSLQNTILARNDRGLFDNSSDCSGLVTSLDNNLVGDPTGCTITLLPHDLTGDPGLGEFTDDGTPGHGHVPLLATSQAIDAGNDAACPPTDQLGQPRVGHCDIGAIEFQPAHRCPLGQGFWKNHATAWPVASLTLGSQAYTQDELLALFDTPPRGDASVILAHQLIAAKLNLANGSNPTPIRTTITDADNLLSGFAGKLPYHVRPSTTTGQAMVNDASVLEHYNNGELTPDCSP